MSKPQIFSVGDVVTWQSGYERKDEPGPFRVAVALPAEPVCSHLNAVHGRDCPNPYPLAHPQTVSIVDPDTNKLKGVMSGSHFQMA